MGRKSDKIIDQGRLSPEQIEHAEELVAAVAALPKVEVLNFGQLLAAVLKFIGGRVAIEAEAYRARIRAEAEANGGQRASVK
jgi:hypothetical protein